MKVLLTDVQLKGLVASLKNEAKGAVFAKVLEVDGKLYQIAVSEYVDTEKEKSNEVSKAN